MAAERQVIARGVGNALWAARGIDGAIRTPEAAVFRARRRGCGAGNRPDKRAGASTLFLCRFTTR